MGRPPPGPADLHQVGRGAALECPLSKRRVPPKQTPRLHQTRPSSAAVSPRPFGDRHASHFGESGNRPQVAFRKRPCRQSRFSRKHRQSRRVCFPFALVLIYDFPGQRRTSKNTAYSRAGGSGVVAPEVLCDRRMKVRLSAVLPLRRFARHFGSHLTCPPGFERVVLAVSPILEIVVNNDLPACKNTLVLADFPLNGWWKLCKRGNNFVAGADSERVNLCYV